MSTQTKNPLPHLQFAVLSILAGAELSGREIRRQLASLGLKKTGPTFYRLMSRLEESGLASGKYEQEVVDGQIVRQRLYSSTARGKLACDETARFHERVIALYRQGESLA